MDRKADNRRQLHKNLSNGLVIHAFQAGLGFLLTPVYLRTLGAEAWGLNAVQANLIAYCPLAFFGLTAVIYREYAVFDPDKPETIAYIQQLHRAISQFFWTITVIVLAAGLLFHDQLINLIIDVDKLETLQLDTVKHAFFWIFITIAVQYPFTLYNSELIAIRQSARAYFASLIVNLSYHALLLTCLFVFEVGVVAFFICQTLLFCFNTLLFRVSLGKVITFPWRIMSVKEMYQILSPHFSYAFDLWILFSVVIGFNVLDREFIKYFFPLSVLSNYFLAQTAVLPVRMIMVPLVNTFGPHLNHVLLNPDESTWRQQYYQSSSWVAFFCTPVAASGIVFGDLFLLLWLKDVTLVYTIHIAFIIHLLSFYLQTIIIPVQSLTQVKKYTRPSFYSQLGLLVIMPFYLYWAVPNWGLGGAATCYFSYVLTLLFTAWCAHRHWLKGEFWLWLRKNLAVPLLVTVLPLLFLRWLLPVDLSRLEIIILAILSYFISCLTVIPVTVKFSAIWLVINPYLTAFLANVKAKLSRDY